MWGRPAPRCCLVGFCFGNFFHSFLVSSFGCALFVVVFICAHVMIPPMLYVHISHDHPYALTFSTP